MLDQMSAAMDQVCFAERSSISKPGTSWNITEILNAADI